MIHTIKAAKKLSDARQKVIGLLEVGLEIHSVRCENPKYWKADCEYFPGLRITTLNALVRAGIINQAAFDEDTRYYFLPTPGEKVHQLSCAICNDAIWQVDADLWSHYGGYPDHEAKPTPEERSK